ncbi:MAG TPA: DinB family protein [Vicinamibacterales bacterium]|jgi:uncharacterized damage-inducible protein DinB
MNGHVRSLEEEYKRYKALGEAAIAQLSEEQLSVPAPGGGNSIAAIVWHVAGNLESRFTDFRTSDGEKPWRNRDEEFEPRTVSRAELTAKWERGWSALFDALGSITDADLQARIRIRHQPLRIDEALHRSLAHTTYHVGQIVFLAKQFCGEQWNCLSIPLGGSRAYNEAPRHESPAAHRERLQSKS